MSDSQRGPRIMSFLELLLGSFVVIATTFFLAHGISDTFAVIVLYLGWSN